MPGSGWTSQDKTHLSQGSALAGNLSRINCLEGSYAWHYTTNAHKSLQYLTAFRAKVQLYTPPSDVQLVRDCPKPGIYFCGVWNTWPNLVVFDRHKRRNVSSRSVFAGDWTVSTLWICFCHFGCNYTYDAPKVLNDRTRCHLLTLKHWDAVSTLQNWQRWDSNPRLRRDWSLNPAPWTARPRYPVVRSWPGAHVTFLMPGSGWTSQDKTRLSQGFALAGNRTRVTAGCYE